MNKCVWCRQTVEKNKGFIGVLCYHDECFRKKFNLKGIKTEPCEHIRFE